MDFVNRIKKEMAEGIVRALLEDAGYRVIDLGLEKVLRELSCLNEAEYLNLQYPDAMRHLPDLTVMDREQTRKFLVEVKYRTKWGREVFEEVEEQAKSLGEITLVSIYAAAPNPKELHSSPARYLRCCGVRWHEGVYQIELRNTMHGKERSWESFDEVEDDQWLWWAMTPLHEKFPKLMERKVDGTLLKAIESLAGILNV